MKKWILEKIINLVGGVSGIIEMALAWFNESVLAKITDKDEFSAYAEDVAAFGFFLDGVLNRHQKWMSEARRTALVSTINAVNELAKALQDANVTKDELDIIIDRVKAAIDAWMGSK